jgi:hypothetical protein
MFMVFLLTTHLKTLYIFYTSKMVFQLEWKKKLLNYKIRHSQNLTYNVVG